MHHAQRLITKALVVGSGIAGGACALELADAGLDVTLLSAGEALDDGNTALAQGGIVYQGAKEAPRVLERDMLRAGWEHNYPKAVRHIAAKGPEAVKDVLIDRLAIPFATGERCEWDLRLEGGHSEQRVLHCTDHTGRSIMDALAKAVTAHPAIRVLTRRTAIDLITSHHHAQSLEFNYQLVNQCAGAYVLNEEAGEHKGHVETILADYTVLATGGAGRIYLHTTNTDAAVGGGLSMAWRAGARVFNAEYVQFHPTTLFHRAERRFLITEAMRGEGAVLINDAGEAFMKRYDSRADLAPRDIVSRSILEEMHVKDAPHVFLDCTRMKADPALGFPTIFAQCKKLGWDIRSEPIPVVPGAHYFCGGVLADLRGRTTLERLYAIGECACTGVHGANRLASTSLLEGLLWGRDAGRDIVRRVRARKNGTKRLHEAIGDWRTPTGGDAADPALIAQDWAAVRSTMWNYVGIVRTGSRLTRAFEDLRHLYKHVFDFYKRTPLTRGLVDLVHGSHAAYIVTMAASRNPKSLGCHYRVD